MSKTVAILQSNYIPWKGYFDLIQQADAFVLYDEVQYTRRDWRNRNKIKTPQGLQWLTIPVETTGRYDQSIWDTRVSDAKWAEHHARTLELFYRKASCFQAVWPRVQSAYDAVAAEPSLSKVNFTLMQTVCQLLEISTPICFSHDIPRACDDTDKNARLIEICTALDATVYLSGPAAQSYIDEAAFARAGLDVRWMSYAGYPEYPQLYESPFEHGVSILDLLFNMGAEARRYIRTGV